MRVREDHQGLPHVEEVLLGGVQAEGLSRPQSDQERIGITNMQTQRVRIKVLIDDSGNYCGYGWRGAGEKDPDDTLYEVIEGLATKAYWIIADLPIPTTEVREVDAVVEAVNG
jgi:hypothetical protein